MRLKAGGALKADNAYQGSVAELELVSKDYGQWRLERPAPIALTLPKVSAGPLCLRDRSGGDAGGSGGCVRFEQTAAGKWNVDLDLDRLALTAWRVCCRPSWRCPRSAASRGALRPMVTF